MTLAHERARAQHAAASEILPGGVSSNFRLNGSPVPLTFVRGEGPRLVDVDGNVYLDYALGMGANILGHAPAPVIEAVSDSLPAGQLYAGQHPTELELARRLQARFPSMERLRFGGSGSEMIHAALRLSRAFTGRSLVVKFEGHYHGWYDDILVNTAGPWGTPGEDGSVPVRPMSAGQVPPANIAVLPWNDATLLDRFLAAHPGEVAAVLNEPVGCNTCVIEPAPGFAEHVRAATRAAGALLIYDEVITGFRLAPGGAQERLGITPDLTVVAKAFGGGFSIAALGGRADVMDLVVTGGVLHGGTFNANTTSIAAGIGVLDHLDVNAYERIERGGTRLMAALAESGARHGLPLHVQGLPSVFNTCFTTALPIRSATDYAKADAALQGRFLVELQERGVRPTARGTWFVSAAHDEDAIEQTVAAADAALAALAAG
ncbi:MAG: aminotransferase class III-fold pyridoxal phosphate-dependent enzyme [Chloroflexota bacterium]